MSARPAARRALAPQPAGRRFTMSARPAAEGHSHCDPRGGACFMTVERPAADVRRKAIP